MTETYAYPRRQPGLGSGAAGQHRRDAPVGKSPRAHEAQKDLDYEEGYPSTASTGTILKSMGDMIHFPAATAASGTLHPSARVADVPEPSPSSNDQQAAGSNSPAGRQDPPPTGGHHQWRKEASQPATPPFPWRAHPSLLRRAPTARIMTKPRGRAGSTEGADLQRAPPSLRGNHRQETPTWHLRHSRAMSGAPIKHYLELSTHL